MATRSFWKKGRKAFVVAPLLGLLVWATSGHPGWAAEQEETVFEDKFDANLAEGWTWIKKTEGAWRIRDGGLEFRVRGQDCILAREVPSSSEQPFAVEVTLTSLPQPTRQYEQGGFGWYFEGKQRFKYVKELIDGKIYVFPGKKEMPAATVQMRIEVRGDQFTAKFRPEAKGEYKTAFSGNIPNKGKGKHMIGLMCFNGPGDAEHWMRFDDFRITKLVE